MSQYNQFHSSNLGCAYYKAVIPVQELDCLVLARWDRYGLLSPSVGNHVTTYTRHFPTSEDLRCIFVLTCLRVTPIGRSFVILHFWDFC